jgi:hypothetical protein
MTITEVPQSAVPDTPVSIPPRTASPPPGPASEASASASTTRSGTGKEPATRKLTATQKWAAAGIVAAALALAGIGLYLSFGSVADFAVARLRFHTLARGRLFSVGVDVGIMVMIAIDLLMAWLKQPIAWIRYPVWLLTGCTVALNAASGAPQGSWELLDYLAAGAHGVVPIMFITVVELARTAIDRVVRPDDPKEERDAIPLIRWVLAFGATARIYRRMRLWGIDSYPEMVRRDQELIAYEQWLRRKHGGDLTQASEDELLPMTMAPYGYTVAEALELPEQQERDAEKRAEEAEQRRLDAATRRELALKQAEAARLEGEGRLEAVRARVEGETGQAQAHARAQVSAAQRAAALEEAALETAVVAEARARQAEADRKTAQERELEAEADLRAAELERQAALKRKEVAEADRVAAAEAQAIETQAIAEARRATAEANRVAAETEKAAAETQRRAAEADRLTAEENKRKALADAAVQEARKREAETELAAAEARLAAAETERRAVEIEDEAKLHPRERAVRKVARMILAAGGNAELVLLADIQRETAVSSTDTASKYRQEAVILLRDGYRPGQ